MTGAYAVVVHTAVVAPFSTSQRRAAPDQRAAKDALADARAAPIYLVVVLYRRPARRRCRAGVSPQPPTVNDSAVVGMRAVAYAAVDDAPS